MKIKLNIYYPALVNSINLPGEVITHGNTVGDCLRDFILQFPGSDKWIFNHKGELSPHVLIFINAESAHSADLNDPVKENDNLLLVAMIAGG